MENYMRYITVEEHERYKKIAEKYQIKGYSIPTTLMCSGKSAEVEKEYMEKREKAAKS